MAERPREPSSALLWRLLHLPARLLLLAGMAVHDALWPAPPLGADEDDWPLGGRPEACRRHHRWAFVDPTHPPSAVGGCGPLALQREGADEAGPDRVVFGQPARCLNCGEWGVYVPAMGRVLPPAAYHRWLKESVL